MSDRKVNGTKVNGSAVRPPEATHVTEPVSRHAPAELPPVRPEFWFGEPLPEEALPPLPPDPAPTAFAGSIPVETPPPGHISSRLSVPPRVVPPPQHLTEPISRRRVPDAEPTELIPRVDAAVRPPVLPPPVLPPPPPVRPPVRPVTPPPRPLTDRTVAAAVAPRLPEPDLDDLEDDDDERDEEGRGRHGKHRRPPRKRPLWREVLVLLGVALLLTFFIQHFIGRVYSIPSGSMEKTLHGCTGCTGDRVFVDKIIYTFRDPQPGDVVVFQGPNTWTEHDVRTKKSDNALIRGLQYLGSLVGVAPPDERDFVKRVIAVGGQTVECCDDQNRVLVNGKPLDEPYVYWERGAPDERQRFARVTVPEGTLWVMGDNRSNSSDSRFQGGGGIRGVVPLGKVIGKARYIVLPPERWQGVGDHNPQGQPSIAAPAWHQGLPAGLGLAAAWPVLWIGRRVKNALIPRKAD